MAIQVQQQQQQVTKQRAHSVLVVVAAIVLAGVVAGALLLHQQVTTMKDRIAGIKMDLEAPGTPEEEALESLVIGHQQRAIDAINLLENRTVFSPLYELVESTMHPQIELTGLSVGHVDHRATLTGEANSYETVSQQHILFSQVPLFRDVSIDQASIEEGGVIKFSATILIDPELFTR